MPIDEIRVLNEEELTQLLESTELPIEKVNILVNNILLKHVMAMKDVEDETKQKFMMSLAEILYGEEKLISTKRLGRVMVYMSLIFDIVN